MAKILAIDSSSKLCAVGLINGDAVTSYQSPTQKAAAQSLLPLIQRLLSEATLSIRDLDAIAVRAGPGSFTGIRIGVGIAQGLSEANSTPCASHIIACPSGLGSISAACMRPRACGDTCP
jgi:tRNA threonylcarbamoyladenosine biosynthesis protein TsaB